MCAKLFRLPRYAVPVSGIDLMKGFEPRLFDEQGKALVPNGSFVEQEGKVFAAIHSGPTAINRRLDLIEMLGQQLVPHSQLPCVFKADQNVFGLKADIESEFSRNLGDGDY